MGNPIVHFEIAHQDAPALHEFYSGIFEWSVDTDNPMGYGMVNTGDAVQGGIGGVPDASYPGHLTFYVQVADIDSKLQEIEKAGGKVAMPKMAIPGGPMIAHFLDPAGHLVGLTEG